MGLILEARSSCLFFFFFESVAYGKAVEGLGFVALILTEALSKGPDSVFKTGLTVLSLAMSSCSRDDITIIESSPEIPQLRQGVLDEKRFFIYLMNIMTAFGVWEDLVFCHQCSNMH